MGAANGQESAAAAVTAIPAHPGGPGMPCEVYSRSEVRREIKVGHEIIWHHSRSSVCTKGRLQKIGMLALHSLLLDTYCSQQASGPPCMPLPPSVIHFKPDVRPCLPARKFRV